MIREDDGQTTAVGERKVGFGVDGFVVRGIVGCTRCCGVDDSCLRRWYTQRRKQKKIPHMHSCFSSNSTKVTGIYLSWLVQASTLVAGVPFSHLFEIKTRFFFFVAD